MRNTKEVKKVAPLEYRDVQALLTLYALKARIAEKKRTERTKMLGDLILLKEIFAR